MRTTKKARPAKPVAVVKENDPRQQYVGDTLEENYMPYAMSVIVSRALPEIDGFKPAHRKLLYTMYKMKLLSGARTKSANIVGQTMKLNPHGDQAIYETMVRLSKGNGALLVPFVDSKGNFGKVYSRDMAYAASRYTEAKLAAICEALFTEIDQDAVDMVDNYDGSMKEPRLLPTRFPNILTSANTGIAVGMACSFCGFNLQEVCATEIAYLKDKKCDLLSTLTAPDFSTGGIIVASKEQLNNIYQTGRGGFKIKSVWSYDKKNNLIEVTEIPYTTTVEAIIDKIVELIKSGKINEVADVRDESDLSGLKLAIDLKKGVDPEQLMNKLFATTPLLDTFSCNFNMLIDGKPKVLGIRSILEEWTKWRLATKKRTLTFELQKKAAQRHLLKGLEAILLNIDKAIKIIRETEKDRDVVPNLMAEFCIDTDQANFVADIRLRNINKEYILKRTAEIASLEKEITRLKATLNSDSRLKTVIIKELQTIIDAYPVMRKSKVEYADANVFLAEVTETKPYEVYVCMSKEGYFKKIPVSNLDGNAEQRLKDGDTLAADCQTLNTSELIFFTNQQHAYKCKLSDFDDGKQTDIGDYLPTKLDMEQGERVISMVHPADYHGYVLIVFENGKIAKVELSSYYTKSNRRLLKNAYYGGAKPVAMLHLEKDCKIILISSSGRKKELDTAKIPAKTSRITQGVSGWKMKQSETISSCSISVLAKKKRG